MHYAAELTKKQTHQEFEDTDIIKDLLDYDADINMQTKLVWNLFQSHLKYNLLSL